LWQDQRRRTLLGLYPATSGKVTIDGADICNAKGRDLLAIRRKAQMIFQDLMLRSTRAGR